MFKYLKTKKKEQKKKTNYCKKYAANEGTDTYKYRICIEIKSGRSFGTTLNL